MSKDLKRALMDIPQKPSDAFAAIESHLEPDNKKARMVGLVAAMFLLAFGLLTYIRTFEESSSVTYAAAEDVESELTYLVGYFNGDDVDEEFDSYAFSSDF